MFSENSTRSEELSAFLRSSRRYRPAECDLAAVNSAGLEVGTDHPPGAAGRKIEISKNSNLLVADYDPHPAVQHPKHDSVLMMIDVGASVVISR